MRLPTIFASSLAFAALAAGGCQNAMYDENMALHTQNRELQDRNKAFKSELMTRPDAAQVASLEAELAAKQQRISDLEGQLSERLNAPDVQTGLIIPGVAGVDVKYDEARGEMTMTIPGDLLFSSGSTALSKGSAATLGRIADIINSDYAGKTVRVRGHTDSDPIKKSKFDSNRDLSLARAYSVTKKLESSGVSATRLETVGLGEHHPTGQGKSKDRRVEIVVVM